MLPLLHQLFQRSVLSKVQQAMDMIGHNDEAETCTLMLGQFIGQVMDDDTLCTMIIQESSPPVAEEGDKMCMAASIKDLSPHLTHFYPATDGFHFPLALRARTTGCPCHP